MFDFFVSSVNTPAVFVAWADNIKWMGFFKWMEL
jgi:hypothetical protein